MINFLSRVVGSQDGENKGDEGMGTWASVIEMDTHSMFSHVRYAIPSFRC